ncbi:MAG: hypothetical protein COX36_02670, partial [Candidatus Nealsonbacteria bacterium CG23_combo_of_CG06-09_8_20_14_all_38_19]
MEVLTVVPVDEQPVQAPVDQRNTAIRIARTRANGGALTIQMLDSFLKVLKLHQEPFLQGDTRNVFLFQVVGGEVFQFLVRFN